MQAVHGLFDPKLKANQTVCLPLLSLRKLSIRSKCLDLKIVFSSMFECAIIGPYKTSKLIYYTIMNYNRKLM